ncbi:MAG: SURF1 family protein [Rhodospirillaceae bacterium]
MRGRRLGFALLCLFCVVVLAGLGTWQLQRLKWKETLIAEMRASYDSVSTVPNPFIREWQQLQVSGRWLQMAPILVGPFSRSGQIVWHVVSALDLDTGGVLFVNLGATKKKELKGSLAGKVLNLSGFARLPRPLGFFSPENEPLKEQWFRVDPEQFGKSRGFGKVERYWVDLVQSPPGSGLLSLGKPDLPANNHLQYAMTWYAFALVASVMGILFWIKNKQSIS